MHPLLKAYYNYREWLAIEPRSWGLYWPMWEKERIKRRKWLEELTEVYNAKRNG